MHHSTKYPLQVYSSLTLASHLKALQKQAKTPNGVQLRRKKVRHLNPIKLGSYVLDHPIRMS